MVVIVDGDDDIMDDDGVGRGWSTMMLVPQITTAAAGVATTTTRGAIDAQWRVVYYVRYVSTTMCR